MMANMITYQCTGCGWAACELDDDADHNMTIEVKSCAVCDPDRTAAVETAKEGE